MPIYPQFRLLLERMTREARNEGERLFVSRMRRKRSQALAGVKLPLHAPLVPAIFITRAIEHGIDVKVLPVAGAS